MNQFKQLEAKCIHDLTDYTYIKQDDYLYKVPKNNLIMLKHLNMNDQLMLSRHLITTNLIHDSLQLIIPHLLTLIRLDYTSYQSIIQLKSFYLVDNNQTIYYYQFY